MERWIIPEQDNSKVSYLGEPNDASHRSAEASYTDPISVSGEDTGPAAYGNELLTSLCADGYNRELCICNDTFFVHNTLMASLVAVDLRLSQQKPNFICQRNCCH